MRTALESAMKQSAAMEIIVLDDGSNDGTGEMVQSEFPSVRLEQFAESAGYISRRNQGASLASSPIVFSIDDDAAFPFPDTVAQTLAEFDDPRIGAVAIPFINVNQSPEITLKSPCGGTFATCNFVGTAYAIRRDAFLNLGGFRTDLIHQGEEMDFCLRMLDAGWVVRIGRADPIHHFESPRRDMRRMDYFGRRNDILFAWNNVPLAALLPHLLMTTCNGVRCGWRAGRLRGMLEGILAGYAAIPGKFAQRRPVKWKTYVLSRALKKHAVLPLESVLHRLAQGGD